jgi:hypothetical protein
MDGHRFLFTGKTYLLGADKITFKTLSGKVIRPHGIQFSTTLNIARFLLEDDEHAALVEIENKKMIGLPVAVFGNSEGSGVITELYGKINEMGSEEFEVSAPFVFGNNGSPVLNTNKQVIGMASYISLIRDRSREGNEKTDDQSEEILYKTRYFCVPLAKNQWITINWKTYNRRYGKPFLKNDQLFSPQLSAVQQWIRDPYSIISVNSQFDPELDAWLQYHNAVVLRMMTFSKKTEAFESELRQINNTVRLGLCSSADRLSLICGKYKKRIGFLSNSPEPSGFVKKEYKHYVEYLGNAEVALPFLAHSLTKKPFFRFKDH